jgi:hypothetical protein
MDFSRDFDVRLEDNELPGRVLATNFDASYTSNPFTTGPSSASTMRLVDNSTDDLEIYALERDIPSLAADNASMAWAGAHDDGACEDDTEPHSDNEGFGDA